MALPFFGIGMKTYLSQSLCDHQNCQLKEKYTTGELWVKFFSGSYWERWPRREPLSSEKLLQSSGVEASLDVIFVMEYMQSCLHLGKRLLLVTKNRYIDFNDYSAFLCMGRCKKYDSLKFFLKCIQPSKSLFIWSTGHPVSLRFLLSEA